MSRFNSLSIGIILALHFLTPLILLPWTSELFEIPKMITVYLLACVLLINFSINQITLPKSHFIFPLMIPAFVLLAILALSSLSSVDVHTSLWGYYSRFHGGLFSHLAFIVLMVITANYIKNDSHKINLIIKTILISAYLVASYATLQKFGIDDHIWKQDVKNRVFSSLGQPNWLAAYLTACIPLAWYLGLTNSPKYQIIFISLSSLFYTSLLFTKSRSGFLAFIVSYLIFWGLTLLKSKTWKKILLFTLPLIIISIIFGTPFNSTFQFIKSSSSLTIENNLTPAQGGTESGIIRLIVWPAALKLGLNYPLLGTGPETFAYTYYWVRPTSHNLVSEWDFLYNKAHNEFLNYFATTGFLGSIAYISFIIAGYWLFYRHRHISPYLSFAAIAAWSAILVTNFFGFSVVAVNLIFYSMPAFFVTSEATYFQTNRFIKVIYILIIPLSAYFLILVLQFFYADLNYAFARKLYNNQDYKSSHQLISKSISFRSDPVYFDLGSKITSDIAVNLATQGQNEAKDFRQLAITLSDQAILNNPAHTTFWRTRAGVFMNLAVIDPNDYQIASHALSQNSQLSPTDPKVPYNQAILSARLKDYPASIDYLTQALSLKPNYVEALYARAIYQRLAAFDSNKLIDETMLQNAIQDLDNYINMTQDTSLISELEAWQQLITQSTN